MIKKTVDLKDFRDEFKAYDRDMNFSYEGQRALFEYLEDLSNDLGEDVELDIIALCCDFTEYESLKELQANYSNIKDLEDLEERTRVIPVGLSNRLIVQNL